MFLGTDRLLALKLLAFIRDLACLLFRRDDVEFITGLRSTVETKDRTGFTRMYLVDTLTAFVEHGFDTTVESTCQHDIAHMERTVLHEQRRYISTTFIE